MILWHNGTFKDEGDPLFPFADRVRLGDGVFDTMLAIVEDGPTDQPPHPIHADIHLSRVLHNANLLGIEPLPTHEELITVPPLLMAENKLEQGRYAINTLITRGPGQRGLALPENPEPQIVMRIAPVPEEFPPVNAVIARTVRRNEGSPLSQIKSINYGDNILALLEAKKKEGNDAILLNNAGNVTCTTAGNLFVVQDGALFTPPLADGVLDGITRKLLMIRYEAQEKSLTEEDLLNNEGLYLTNSIRGAVPISTLDGQECSVPSLEIDKDFHLN